MSEKGTTGDTFQTLSMNEEMFSAEKVSLPPKVMCHMDFLFQRWLTIDRYNLFYCFIEGEYNYHVCMLVVLKQDIQNVYGCWLY